MTRDPVTLSKCDLGGLGLFVREQNPHSSFNLRKVITFHRFVHFTRIGKLPLRYLYYPKICIWSGKGREKYDRSKALTSEPKRVQA